MISIDIKPAENRLREIADSRKTIHKKASVSAQNNVGMSLRTFLSREISRLYGFKVSSVRESIRLHRASLIIPSASLVISGKRLQYTGRKKITRKGKQIGVSYIAEGRRRVKRLDYVKPGASKLFMIKGRDSGKDIIVYRKPGQKKKVTGYVGSSMAHMASTSSVRSKVSAFIKSKLPVEYERQLLRYRR